MSALSTLTVIGAGTMGHGIAQVAALSGYRAVLVDAAPEALERALVSVRENLEKGVSRGKLTAADRDRALANLGTADSIETGVAGAEVVVEAVPEILEVKQRIFATLGEVAPASAILGTNTSSLPVGEIAGATTHPERVVGMHFFNPVHIMQLLEIVQARDTSEATVTRAREIGARLGKECIVVRDVPGFATSRLGLVLGLEAMRMVEQEVASAQDIDTAMTLGYRHPMGPLRLTDLVGLDVRLAIAEHLYRELGSEAFRPPGILRSMVAEGKLGRKSGVGFYDWE